MSASALSSRRLLVLVALLIVALLAWSAARAGSEAAPQAASAKAASAKAGTAQAGKVVLESLPGAARATLPVRSFSAGRTNTSDPVGGGGGGGRFVPEEPALVVDASDVDPLLLRAVATGVHLPKATVTIFRPGTNDRQQVWEFADVTVSQLRTAQTGSAKPPPVSIGLGYARVTVTTYDARGAVARTFCFAVDAGTTC